MKNNNRSNNFYIHERRNKYRRKLKNYINSSEKIIAVDFDGTLCENKWPQIGEVNEVLINYLRKRQSYGDKIILWTCREGRLLREAILACYDYGLIFDAVNANIPEIIDKFGNDSRKIYANEYIDDKSSIRFKLPYKSRNNEIHYKRVRRERV